jgi:Phage capsid protein
MAIDIEKAFVKQFEREVHEAYQRMGSKLRMTVRSKNNVRGSSAVFQKVGKGSAVTKSRHGVISAMNVDHEAVDCALADYYAGDWVDKLDELKISIDERSVIANAGAYALGRKTDDLIIAELDKSENIAQGDGGLDRDKVLAAFEMLGEADVPDDGQRYAVVGWKQWSQLLAIPEFADADYVGADELPWRGTQAKKWLGSLWMPHSGLTKRPDGLRLCHWYHKTAVGHASGADVTTDITWHGDRAAHFVNSMMSQGACLIDPTGVVTLRCTE